MDAWGVTVIICGVALLLHHHTQPRDWFLVAGMGAGYFLAFAVNDYCDAALDRLDPDKAQRNFFVQHPLTPAAAFLLFLLPLLVVLPALSQFGLRGLLWTLVCLAILWAYSAPPFRLKSKPGLDLLVHGLFVESFPYWLCLRLLAVAWGGADYLMLAVLVFASLAAQLEQQLRDRRIDRQHNATFTVVIGPMGAPSHAGMQRRRALHRYRRGDRRCAALAHRSARSGRLADPGAPLSARRPCAKAVQPHDLCPAARRRLPHLARTALLNGKLASQSAGACAARNSPAVSLV